MKSYSSEELLMSLLQFFSMDAEQQLNYAPSIPADLNVKNFAFGLSQSPLLEMAEGTENISRVLVDDQKRNIGARQSLEEFHAALQLIEAAWRLVRKLGRECLRQLGVAPAVPTVPYEELVPFIMD
jgi:hypothetical protein